MSKQNDACFKFNGKYVDFVRSWEGLWSVLFDNRLKTRTLDGIWVLTKSKFYVIIIR